jgi:hypothetical protein
MGFSTTLSSSTTALGNSVVMTRTCNFLQIPRINMKCRDLANSQGVGLEGSFSYSDIIISIPNDAPLSGKINYSNTTQIMNQLEIRDLKRFRVCFCDDDNNLINFNGLSCYFAFQFDIYRQPKLIKDPTFRQLFNQ